MASFRLTRRGLLRSATAASASVAAAPFVRFRPLRSSLKLAAVGAGNRGASNIAGVLGEDVALLCDVDSEMLARGLQQIETAGQVKPKTYVDWRELLLKEEDFDGIVISTPDHTHAAIARNALRKGLAVYCEKPLSRTIAEARVLRKLAQDSNRPTQMGTQIHATDNYRRVVEAIQADAIGEVHTVHVVCSKSWSAGKFGPAIEVPKTLNWDLWLGPRPSREYSAGVHPANWRRFWDYGTGTVGDMACHWVDLVHWALKLDVPNTVEVEGDPADAVGTPTQMHAKWGHPRTDTRSPVQVHWWDGGMQPEDEEVLPDCHLFIGSKGRIVSTYGTMKVTLDDDDAVWEAPEQTIPSSPGHYEEWLRAIRDGGPKDAPLCSFDYGTNLSETVLLATVAYRAGKKITWDTATGEASAGQEFVDGGSGEESEDGAVAPDREGWDL